MASITSQARCGLPTNPREWLLEKKKNSSKGSSNTNSRATVERQHPPTDEIDAKSPIIEGEFEDLIACYSTLDEDHWTHSRSPRSTSLTDPYIRPPTSQKSNSVRDNSPSDRSSSISEGSNVSILSNASGKSARRKNRIFPGLFGTAAIKSPLSINLSLAPRANLQEVAGLSNQLFPNQRKLQQNVEKYQPTSSLHGADHDGFVLRDHPKKNSKPKVSDEYGHSDPLSYSALQEAVPSAVEEESCWDDFDVLEAYSSFNSEDGSLDSYSKHSNDAQVQMKFNLTISVSEEYNEHDDYSAQLATYGSLLANAPHSAKSDLSRYSVESA